MKSPERCASLILRYFSPSMLLACHAICVFSLVAKSGLMNTLSLTAGHGGILHRGGAILP